MEGFNESMFIEGSKHIPTLLRRQLLCHLTTAFLSRDYTEDGDDNFKSDVDYSILTKPSIERFYGALLFVDISGFTPLSLKLDVETLKNHINEYFTKMLDVIDKWNGDVIKFAGDALYIVWPVHLSSVEEAVKGVNESITMDTLLSTPQFLDASKSAVQKAVHCALEINHCCCHHKIIIGDHLNPSKQRWTKLFNALPAIMPQGTGNNSSETPAPTSVGKGEDEVVYLNVHSGIGFGLLAGVDIGVNDRWEYFLIGDPISQSAHAEERAKIGELVVSHLVHGLLHEEEHDLDHFGNVNEEDELPCSCHRLEGRFFRISSQAMNSARVNAGAVGRRNSIKRARRLSRSLSKSKLENFYLLNQEDIKDMRRMEDLRDEIQVILRHVFPAFKPLVLKFLSEYQIDISDQQTFRFGDPDDEDDDGEGYEWGDDDDTTEYGSRLSRRRSNSVSVRRKSRSRSIMGHLELPEESESWRILQKEAKLESKGEDDKPTSDEREGQSPTIEEESNTQTEQEKKELEQIMKQRKVNKMVLKFIHTKLKPFFIKWLMKSLLDDIIRHTHEAPRKRFEYANLLRLSVLEDYLKNYFFFPGSLTKAVMKRLPTIRNIPNLDISGMGPGGAKLVKQSSKAKNFVNDVGLSAELRSVTVMFINISELDVELYVEDPVSPPPTGFPMEEIQSSSNSDRLPHSSFNFVQRSRKQEKADEDLLFRLQSCIAVISHALFENGGQLRQFIIDDKGTVCIGTFGLRGSMAVDNAASAIECAKAIVTKLNELKLVTSIGITTGKGYCGTVGSKFRHEYAVMGPSTNLSARLMGKAAARQILCDTDTRQRDRTHRFKALSAIKAKGYAELVQTYMPVFDDPTYPGPNRDALDLGDSVEGHRVGGLRQNSSIMRSSLDSVILESFLTHSMKVMGDRQRSSLLLNNASIKNGDTMQTETASELLRELVSSTLVVHKRRGSRDYSVTTAESTSSTVASTLYGRKEEIEGIVKFLILPFCYEPKPPPISSPPLTTKSIVLQHQQQQQQYDGPVTRLVSFFRGVVSPVKAEPPVKTVVVENVPVEEAKTPKPPPPVKFDINTSARLLAVSGKEGYGKSSLVTAVARKVFTLARNNSNYNITVMKNRLSTVIATSPFQSIRPVIQEMLIKFNNFLNSNDASARGKEDSSNRKGGNNSGPRQQQSSPLRSSLGGGKRASMRMSQISTFSANSRSSLRSSLNNGRLSIMETQMKNGLTAVAAHLSADQQILLPLLSSFQIVKGLPDNYYTASLNSKAQLFGVLDVICEIIDLYPKITGKTLFFVFEKLHLFDSWSLSCINQVWRQSKGILILCTYTPVVRENAPSAITAPAKSSPQSNDNRSMIRVQSNKRLNGTLSSPGGKAGQGAGGISTKEMMTVGFDEEVFFHQYYSESAQQNQQNENDIRFKIIHLQLLDKESIESIAKESVNSMATLRTSISTAAITAMNATMTTTSHSQSLTELLMNKVYEISGGNPLYAMAIVNSVNLSEIAAMQNSNDGSAGGKQQDTLDQILSNATNRIGEVICYRFDQLDTLTQVILKSAAVISSYDNNQATFTLDTLLFLLDDQEDSHPHEKDQKDPLRTGKVNFADTIANAGKRKVYHESAQIHEVINCLKVLLDHEEFIQIVGTLDEADTLLFPISAKDLDVTINPNTKSGSSSNSITDAMIRRSRFSFRVIIEQMTIYDLLVDEQKHQIHESVAIYYHQLIEVGPAADPNNPQQQQQEEATMQMKYLLPEAFHWQNALVYPFALACHFDAAKLYQEEGDYQNFYRQLQLANDLHQMMRLEATLLSQTEFTVSNLLQVFEEYDQDIQTVATNYTSSNHNSNSHHKITKAPGATSGNTSNMVYLTPLKTAASRMMMMSMSMSASEDSFDGGMKSFIDRSKYMPAATASNNQILNGSKSAPLLLRSSLIPDDTEPSSTKNLGNDNLQSLQSALASPSAKLRGYQVNEMNGGSNTFYNEMNAKLLFEMCYGDGESFSALIASQIAFARCHVMTLTGAKYALTMLEDTFMLLLLYHKYVLLQVTSHELGLSDGLSTKSFTSVSNWKNRLHPSREKDEEQQDPTKKKSVAVRFLEREGEQAMQHASGSFDEDRPAKMPSIRKLALNEANVMNFLVDPALFDAYLCEVYALYLWLLRQSPLCHSRNKNNDIGEERMKKAWFFCEKYLQLTSQSSSYGALVNYIRLMTIGSDAPPSPVPRTQAEMGNKLKPISEVAQKSQRFAALRVASFRTSVRGIGGENGLSPPPSMQRQVSLAGRGGNVPNQSLPLNPVNSIVTKVHSVHATCLHILYLLQDNQSLSKAVKRCDRILLNYSISKYSSTMIQYYGYDITQYTITILCQHLLLVGEIEKSFHYFTIVFENIYQYNDSYSIYLTLLPLFSICLLLRKYSDAYELLLFYETVSSSSSSLTSLTSPVTSPAGNVASPTSSNASSSSSFIPTTMILPTLITLQMKYLLVISMILWNDLNPPTNSSDGNTNTTNTTTPLTPVKSSDMTSSSSAAMTASEFSKFDEYYHRFLSNSFTKRNTNNQSIAALSPLRHRGGGGVDGMTSSPERHYEDLIKIQEYYQNEVIALRQRQSTDQVPLLSLPLEGGEGGGVERGKHLGEMTMKDFAFLRHWQDRDEGSYERYLDYFLYSQGCAIESIVTCGKLLQLSVTAQQRYEESKEMTSSSSTSSLESMVCLPAKSELLKCFEEHYSYLIQLKHRYISTQPPAPLTPVGANPTSPSSPSPSSSSLSGSNNSSYSVYSELMTFSILLSLFHDYDKLYHTTNNMALTTALSREITCSISFFQEFQLLLQQSEEFHYSLSLAVFTDIITNLSKDKRTSLQLQQPIITTAAEQQEHQNHPNHQNNANITDTTTSEGGVVGGVVVPLLTASLRTMCKEIRKKESSYLQQQFNTSQLKGFEYILHRISNI